MKTEYYIIKPEDDFCNSEDSLNNLFMSNAKVKIEKSTFSFEDTKVQYQVSTAIVGNPKERIFRIAFSSEERDQEKAIGALEIVSRILRKILKEAGKDFKINIVWDEIAQYYCKLAYPIINNVENQMRKLIFRFMIENVGSGWVENAMPKEIRDALQKNAERSKIKSLIENCLYEADFVHLIQFMFVPYTMISSTKELFDKLDEIKDKAGIDILKSMKPQSNWDRYFSSFIKFEKFDEKWNELYCFRNKVAHNKLISRTEFEELNKLSTQIANCLEKAMLDLDKAKVPEMAKESLGKSAIRTIESGIASASPTLPTYDYSGIFDLMETCTVCKQLFYRTKPLFLSDSKVCSICSGISLIPDRSSIYGFQAESPYLNSAAAYMANKPYTSVLGDTSYGSIYSSVLWKTCSKCGKTYMPDSGSSNIRNRCPECENLIYI
jgi:hypothetical protein